MNFLGIIAINTWCLQKWEFTSRSVRFVISDRMACHFFHFSITKICMGPYTRLIFGPGTEFEWRLLSRLQVRTLRKPMKQQKKIRSKGTLAERITIGHCETVVATFVRQPKTVSSEPSEWHLLSYSVNNDNSISIEGLQKIFIQFSGNVSIYVQYYSLTIRHNKHMVWAHWNYHTNCHSMYQLFRIAIT